MSLKTSALFIAALVCAATLGAQTTRNVPTPSYPTIQSALAVSVSGDTVLVGPGTYQESNLSFGGHDISLIGAGAAQSVIDAASVGRCFLFTSGETSAARVEGFSLRNGRAPNGATGTSGSPNGKNGQDGGAILIQGASPTIVDCLFAMNAAGNGGAAFDVALGIQGAPGGQGGLGGAIMVVSGNPIIQGCIFDTNHAGDGGAGRGKGFATQGGQPGHGDGGNGGHGGAIALTGGTAVIDGCNFLANRAGNGGIGSASASLGGASGSGGLGGDGGGLHIAGGLVQVIESNFSTNLAGLGGNSPAAIGGTAGSGGKGGNGGGVNVTISGQIQLDRVEFTSNKAGNGGPGGDSGAFFSVFGLSGRGGNGGLGGAICSSGSTNVDRLVALANEAGTAGAGGAGYGVVSGVGGDGGHGGALALLDGGMAVTNATLARNVSGGGGYGGPSSANNHNSPGAAGTGGAIVCAVGTLDLASSVLYDNKLGAIGLGGFNFSVPGQPGAGAGILFASGVTNVVNSIIYANLNAGGTPDNIFSVGGGITVSYSDVQGGWPGTANFASDPMFVDAGNDDFHLSSGSPCRDVGDNAAALLPTFDFEGELRVICGVIDVGADEFLVLPAIAGQAPRPGLAVFDINNAVNIQGCDVSTSEAGPYYAQTPVGAPITFSFEGQPFQPIICVWHYLNVNNVNYGPLAGQFDIGGPPDLSGIPIALTVFADGTYTYAAPFAYVLDGSGQASYTYTMPFFPSGILCAFQSAILNTTGIKMSNAIELTVP